MSHRSRFQASILAALAALAGGCLTTDATRYAPSLASLSVPFGKDGAGVTALVSVVGVAAARDRPAGIEVRLRLDNHGKHTVRLAPGGLEAVTADLGSLGSPELIPAGPVEVAPGGEATVSAEFAIPPERKPSDEAMRALNLRFVLEADGQSYASSVTFDRVERRAPPPYDYWPAPGFVTGPVIVVRHHRPGA